MYRTQSIWQHGLVAKNEEKEKERTPVQNLKVQNSQEELLVGQGYCPDRKGHRGHLYIRKKKA
jgi:hypothetical protein